MAPNPGQGGNYPNNLPPAGGKEISMDHDVIEDVVKKLRADYEELKNQQHHEHLEDVGPTEAAIGDYSAGKGLYMTVSSARNAISGTFGSFLNSYKMVIDALERSQQNLRTADQNSAAAARRAGRVD